MSPLLLIVLIPLVVGGAAFLALLVAAATAGPRDAFEEHPQEGTTAAEAMRSRVAPSEPSSARAAGDEAERRPRTGKGLTVLPGRPGTNTKSLEVIPGAAPR